MSYVDASPYRWPFDGNTAPDRTALFCIDWQADFCGRGGYADRMGYDISLTRAGKSLRDLGPISGTAGPSTAT
ncbi:hypothetical protein V1460_05465 [Streptomyces sp. SCSIO 30461]|uniref:hypothetical protein n=1 Tax=Streptomyces sp. SCSIO 30461 TaxID=3118085 RepID=UPI0030D09274